MAEVKNEGVELPCRVVFADDGSLTLTCRPPWEKPTEPAGEAQPTAETE